MRTQETKEDRECQVCLRKNKYIPDRDRFTVEFCFSFFYLRRVMLVPPHSFCSSSTTFDTFSLQGSEELRLPEGSTLSSARARYGQFSAHDQHDLHDHGQRLKFFR